jgi:hypothetical protein
MTIICSWTVYCYSVQVGAIVIVSAIDGYLVARDQTTNAPSLLSNLFWSKGA